jgi:hypothetical protein
MTSPSELYPLPPQFRLYSFQKESHYSDLAGWYLIANGVDVLIYKTQQKKAFLDATKTASSYASFNKIITALQALSVNDYTAGSETGLGGLTKARMNTSIARWSTTDTSVDAELGKFQPYAVRLEQIMQVMNNIFQEKMAELRASTVLSALVDPYVSQAVEGGLSSGTSIALP